MADVMERLNATLDVTKESFHRWQRDGTVGSTNELCSSIAQAPTSDLGMELEIAFRQCMEMLMESDQSSGLSSSSAAFVRFTVDFAESVVEHCPNFGKVPFQLIDDLLEDKNISEAKALWPLLESLAEKLTTESLFSKGKFIMLKTCNFLLKKLSKSSDTEFCGRVLLFLAAIYPISEKSAVNLAGKINTGNVTYFDDKATFEGTAHRSESKEAAKETQEDGETTADLHVTYQLYSSFWKLQTLLASDLRALDQTTPSWKEFMTNARAVADLLKLSCQISSVDTSKSRSKASTGSSVDYQGTKYLTSSQLFGLQLRDPLLRQQVAVQLLLFSHYLKSKALAGISNAEQRMTYLKDIIFLHDSAKSVLEMTCKGLVQILHRILDREENWMRWKSAGCTPFERTTRVALPSLKRAREIAQEAETAQKAQSNKKRAMTRDSSASYVFDCSIKNIQRLTEQQTKSGETLEDKIQEYLDADDPENGIEEEYHPKNDSLFCWRTRRLLAQRDVTLFQNMVDGDLGKILRKYKNIPEPEPKLADVVSEEATAAPEEEGMAIDAEPQVTTGDASAEEEEDIQGSASPSGSMEVAEEFVMPEGSEEEKEQDDQEGDGAQSAPTD